MGSGSASPSRVKDLVVKSWYVFQKKVTLSTPAAPQFYTKEKSRKERESIFKVGEKGDELDLNVCWPTE